MPRVSNPTINNILQTILVLVAIGGCIAAFSGNTAVNAERIGRLESDVIEIKRGLEKVSEARQEEREAIIRIKSDIGYVRNSLKKIEERQ